jgi:hypothetical protein
MHSVFSSDCGVAHFREPNTIYSVSVTDYYSTYYYISFLPHYTAKIVADLPFSFMSIWTSYTTQTKVIAGLLDSDIVLDNGAPNPFVPGNNVMSTQRSYTIYAGKNKSNSIIRFADSDPQDPIITNWLSTDSGDEEKISMIVLRVIGEYGDAANLSSSSDWLPTVTLMDAKGNKERCNFFRDQARLYTTADTYNGDNNNGERDGCNIFRRAEDAPSFSFYPLTAVNVGFANTAGGGYIHANPEYNFTPDEMRHADPESWSFAIEFKNPPRVFDPLPGGSADNNQVYDDVSFDARYTSLCLYVVGQVEKEEGEQEDGNAGNNCVTGVDIYNAFQQHGISYVVGGNDAAAKRHAEENGIPYLDLRGWDSPYFIYRVLLANDASFDLDLNVPRWVGVFVCVRVLACKTMGRGTCPTHNSRTVLLLHYFSTGW